MTNAELEVIIDAAFGPDRRATAMAALTLRRLLDAEWTHVVTVRETKGTSRQETVRKPAGSTVGSRDALSMRLAELLAQL